MNRRWLSVTGFYIFGPIVLVLVVASFWLVFMAMAENSRLGKATEQIIGILSVARYMPFSPNATPDRALNDFYDQIAKARSYEIVQLTPSTADGQSGKVIKNPWGGNIKVSFIPYERIFSLETAIPSSVCRKILLLYSRDLQDMGIRRIEVKEDSFDRNLWRLIYEQGNANFLKGLPVEAIYVGCGNDIRDLVRFTFSL